MMAAPFAEAGECKTADRTLDRKKEE